MIPISALLANYDPSKQAMGSAIVGLFYVYLIFFSFSEPVAYIYMVSPYFASRSLSIIAKSVSLQGGKYIAAIYSASL